MKTPSTNHPENSESRTSARESEGTDNRGSPVRGLLPAKVPNSSFAEEHSVLLPEPILMEDEGEDEDQENENEDEKDGEECKMECRRESKQPLRMKHG